MNTSFRGRAALALCLLLGLQVRAQKQVVTFHDRYHKRPYQVASVNASGQYNGPFKEYFPSGNIAKDYTYRNGEMHGKCTDYFDANGVSIPASVQSYNNGVAEGLWKEFKGSTRGSGYATFVETETLYKQGAQLWRKTYQEAEAGKACLRKEELFQPGSWTVVTERGYRCDGHLWYTKSDTGRNFQEEGGTVSMEFYNRDGVRNGPYREWYPGTKQLGVSGTYRDGKLDGPYQEWSKAGVLTLTTLFKMGTESPTDSTATSRPE